MWFWPQQILLKCGKGNFSVFALGTQGLGVRDEIPVGMVHQIATMFKIDASNICRSGGRKNLLTGQNTGSILQRPLILIWMEKSNFLLQIAKDLSLHRTEASEDLTIWWVIGEGHTMCGNCLIFKSQMKRGNFTFYADPTPTEVSTLNTSYCKATYSVQNSTLKRYPSNLLTTGMMKMNHITIPSKPNQGNTNPNSSVLRKISCKIRAMLFRPRKMPRFSNIKIVLFSD